MDALPETLTATEQRAVDTALRWTHRLHHPSYGRDDMRQEASVAVLLARVRLSADYTTEETEAYYARRAFGGVIEGLREVLRQDGVRRTKGAASVPGERYTSRVVTQNEVEDNDTTGPLDDDCPIGNVAVSQAMHAISRMKQPLPQLALLCISGSSMAHIAELLDLHPSQVSRLRNELARQLTKFL